MSANRFLTALQKPSNTLSNTPCSLVDLIELKVAKSKTSVSKNARPKKAAAKCELIFAVMSSKGATSDDDNGSRTKTRNVDRFEKRIYDKRSPKLAIRAALSGGYCYSMSQRPTAREWWYFLLTISVMLGSSMAFLPMTANQDACLRTLPPKSNQDILEEEAVTPAAITRQFFLSSVGSGFVSIVSMVTDSSSPQAANAMEFNKFDISDPISAAAAADLPSVRVLSMKLISLPLSGCWATKLTVANDDDFYSYTAIVDTGSPFLTAPADAFSKTAALLENKKKKWISGFPNAQKSESDITYEQYGTTVGSVQWRMAPYVTLIGNSNIEIVRTFTQNSEQKSKTVSGNRQALVSDSIAPEIELSPVIVEDKTDFVLGIPSEEVIAETGGIFLGLMTVDAARPTPLQQLGYDAFAMQFKEDGRKNRKVKTGRTGTKQVAADSNDTGTLVLWDGRQRDARNKIDSSKYISLINRFDPYAMKLFDLRPYGPNLHHYGVLCNRFECRWSKSDRYEAVSFNCIMKNGVNECASSGMTLSRPLVAVFDTGLSGCIFSDTLWDEIQMERRRLERDRKQLHNTDKDDDTEFSRSMPEVMDPIGCTVWLPIIGDNQPTSIEQSASKDSFMRSSEIKLSSTSKYWRFQSFRLPWWYADNDTTKNSETKNYWDDATDKIRRDKFPHVVVLGSAFWRNPDIEELAVDTVSERAKITKFENRIKK